VNSALQQAAVAGNRFNDHLAESTGNQTTKWFKTIPRKLKGAMLAVMVAAGASGCATVNQEMQAEPYVSPASSYQSMVEEVRNLESLPRDELMAHMADRPASKAFTDLERIGVADLAEQLASFQRGDRESHPLADGPMRLQNLFSGAQPIQITLNTDPKGARVVAGMMTSDPDLVDVFTEGMEGLEHPLALTQRPADAGIDSFNDGVLPGAVMLPETIDHEVARGLGWAPNDTPEHQAENMAFIVLHEGAHLHETQWMTIHGGDNPKDGRFLEAMKNTYETSNETHSHLSPALSLYKMYDLTPEQFMDRLDRLQQLENEHVMRGGLKGPQQNADKLGRYRAGKAIEVLKEIVERDPDFIKNLSYEAIPYVAYDITQHAGYYHNAAEMILATEMDRVASSLGEAQRRDDMSLIREAFAVDKNYPAFMDAWETLDRVWSQKAEMDDYLALQAALEAYPETGELSDEFYEAREVLPEDTRSDLSEALIAAHVDSDPGDRDHYDAELANRLAILKNQVNHTLNQMPDRDTLDVQRADALLQIESGLTELNAVAQSSDALSDIARGENQPADQVAEIVMSRYQDSLEQAHYIADNYDPNEDQAQRPRL